MKLADIAAVIVTRGDVELADILRSLPFDQVVIWNNGDGGPDLGVYGRYEAIKQTTKPYIFVQDDDCIVDAARLAGLFSGESLMINVPADEHQAFVGWGAIFPRSAPSKAFRSYLAHFKEDRFFHQWADVIFSSLAPTVRVDIGHRNLPWAFNANRMYQQPSHYIDQERMRLRCKSLSA